MKPNLNTPEIASNHINKNRSYLHRVLKNMQKEKSLYVMIIPVLAYYLVFHYKPLYGAIIAFKEFSPGKGIRLSPWVGFKHFTDFFKSMFFGRVLKNTITISLSSIIFGFPAPIILALLINELKSKYFSRAIQTISYMPHFISMVVVCGLIRVFTKNDGIITNFLYYFGFERVSLLENANLFVPIYVISGIWQEIGWGSIIYLAALTGIDAEMYEASRIDGSGRWKQTLYITLPSLMPTIIIMLILRLGRIMSVGFEKVILLYNPLTYVTADVISSYVYRKGILEFNWSFSSAVGLFNSVINFLFIVMANWISRKVNESSLW
ncbi:MAG TPA: ABC transporter permease subunit [Clostridiales bacterium]|nr:ABC transporter permease subunit [Clostridiales bacterium]